MRDKIIGYVLLFVGIVIMLFSTASVYLVFTKQTKPINLFNFEGISINPNDFNTIEFAPEFEKIAKKKEAKPIQIIKKEMLNELLNIFAYIAFMSFLLNLGSKIGTLGVKVISPPVVK